jgi:hypothetical protein
VTNYTRRCRGRITWYNRQLKKNPAQKAIYEKKINSYRFRIRRCRGYWRKPAVRKIQKRTVKKVFKRPAIKTVVRRGAVIKYTNKINNLKKLAKTS